MTESHRLDKAARPSRRKVVQRGSAPHGAISRTGESAGRGPRKAASSHGLSRVSSAGASLLPAGYVRLDDTDARMLTPGEGLFTPHPSAGAIPGGWGLAPVVVESVREDAWGDDKEEPKPCHVVRASVDGRVLAFAPGDLCRTKARRGKIA